MSFARKILIAALIAGAGCQFVEDPTHPNVRTEPGDAIVDESWRDGERLTRIDATHFRIERELWAELPSLAETEQAIRVVPTMRDGVLYGGQLHGIEGGSLADQLGFENGDVVRRINALSVFDAEDAFAAYYEAFDLRAIEVHILRDGHEQTLHYEID